MTFSIWHCESTKGGKHSSLYPKFQLILVVPTQPYLFKIALQKICYLISPKKPYVNLGIAITGDVLAIIKHGKQRLSIT